MIFNSPFADGVITTKDIFLCLGVALVMGIVFSFMCYYRSKSTKSFLVATSLLPVVVALVIILVNGNIGTGIAIAGAFSLVRFRSAPGTAKEIAIIFISMAAGLAFGIGYLGYGVIFMIAAGLVLMLFEKINIWDTKLPATEKIVRITIPEELDYTVVFDEVFEQYTKRYEIIKVQSINMGSMFKVYYEVSLKDAKDEKKLIDDIRVRNGNLEVSIQRIDYKKSKHNWWSHGT